MQNLILTSKLFIILNQLILILLINNTIIVDNRNPIYYSILYIDNYFISSVNNKLTIIFNIFQSLYF